MIKQILKNYLPDHQKICEYKNLQIFGDRLHDPNLWHLNRRSVAGAVGMGLFIALIPLPVHTPLAALMAIWLRLNLPITLVAAYLTNPITIPPIFYFAYKVGTWLLNTPPHEFMIEFSRHWLLHETGAIWLPLLVGSLTVGLVLGVVSYLTINLLWRYGIVRRRRRLLQARLRQSAET